MSKEHSVFTMSAPGLLAQSVGLLSFHHERFYNTRSYHLYCTPAKFSFSGTARKYFVLWSWKELPLLSFIKSVPIPAIKQDDPPPWVTENLTTHPSKGSQTDDPPLHCSGPPPSILFDQSVSQPKQSFPGLS